MRRAGRMRGVVQAVLLTAVFGTALGVQPAQNVRSYDIMKKKTDQVFYDFYKSENKPIVRNRENLKHLPTKHFAPYEVKIPLRGGDRSIYPDGVELTVRNPKRTTFTFGISEERDVVDRNVDGRIDFFDADVVMMSVKNSESKVKDKLKDDDDIKFRYRLENEEEEEVVLPIDPEEGGEEDEGGVRVGDPEGGEDVDLDDELAEAIESGDFTLSEGEVAVLIMAREGLLGYFNELREFFRDFESVSGRRYMNVARQYRESKQRYEELQAEKSELMRTINELSRALDACQRQAEDKGGGGGNR